MEQHQLAAILQQHGIETQSLAPLMASGQGYNYRLSVDGADALALWQKPRALVDETGVWPVLLGGIEWR